MIERHEMYGWLFDLPQPDELVLVSSFSGGEIFRSGCCFRRRAVRLLGVHQARHQLRLVPSVGSVATATTTR